MARSLLSLKEVEMVRPSQPTPSCLLSLSALDSQLFLRFTIEYLLVYRPSPAVNKAAVAARIKAALARALVPYYPLAGRVVAVPPNGGDGGCSNLKVVCEAQGALFVQAVSDRCAVSDFERAPSHVTEWRKLLAVHVVDVLAGAPPLVVQLTWLADGGAALGVGINHCLCDGIGSAEFLNAFADLAAGLNDGLAGFKPNPVWDRHLLDPTEPTPTRNQIMAAHPEFDPVQDLCGFVSRFNHEQLSPTSICFSKRCLDELQSRAASTGQPDRSISYTSFEVLTAHVWRSWARALELPPNQTLKLLFTINIRSRVKPNLPGGYYGNGFVLGCAETSAKCLAEKGLEYAAELVKGAKETVDEEHVRGVVEAVSGSTWARPDSVGPGVLIVSQWSRLGLEKVDLGMGMGRPVHVGPVCSDRYCLLLPVDNRREAVKVTVALPASAVDQYERLVRSPYS
ncbi:alcohol acyltransferase 9 [Malania oleifera]|uniref:alcohol acyltransferase 9 n=1 Tax=Malania oleifera TaxID=397392 RepID=UPI0025AE4FF0|nr:alcohol acyltransferase 9 [Malania oleifera]